MKIEHKKELFRLYKEMTQGFPHPFIIAAEDNVNYTREARAFAAKNDGSQPFTCVAVVAQNLAYKLMADFYFKFNKSVYPHKVVTSIDKAVEWIKEYAANNQPG